MTIGDSMGQQASRILGLLGPFGLLGLFGLLGPLWLLGTLSILYYYNTNAFITSMTHLLLKLGKGCIESYKFAFFEAMLGLEGR